MCDNRAYRTTFIKTRDSAHTALPLDNAFCLHTNRRTLYCFFGRQQCCDRKRAMCQRDNPMVGTPIASLCVCHVHRLQTPTNIGRTLWHFFLINTRPTECFVCARPRTDRVFDTMCAHSSLFSALHMHTFPSILVD